MNLCLYAYVAPRFDEILYIGKTYGCSVKRRWSARDKGNFWRELERVRGIYKHVLIVGAITLTSDEYMPRFTGKKVADIESLLIFAVQPWGNIACRKSRIERSNMIVRCSGDWPLLQKTFRDN
ncbi:MAG: hypothetical protein ABI923_03830 [bacterium]